MHTPRSRTHRRRGFTLIELVIVMAMLGLLLSLALPHYMATLERGREQVLQQNLATMREAIDKFYGDTGKYPDTLADLVTARYLRAIPPDPYSEAPTWVVVAPRDADKGGVIDVQSTLTDNRGEPRTAPGADPAGAKPLTDSLPNLVTQEGGTTRVEAVAPAASARADGVPTTGAAR
jgi:general secretion pathway protein G